jgi:tetratricopeptide (TPR) repeat protein
MDGSQSGNSEKKRWDKYQEFFEMGQKALDESEPEFAILFFEQALSVAHYDPECLYLIGLAYHRAYRYDRAEEYYWKSVLQAPLLACGWSNLARLKFELTLYNEAVMLYQRSLEIQPARPDVWRQLGDSYEALGRLEDAKECYQVSFELDPDDKVSAYCLACMCAELGDVDSSLALLSDLIHDPFFLISARQEKVFNETSCCEKFRGILWADENVL